MSSYLVLFYNEIISKILEKSKNNILVKEEIQEDNIHYIFSFDKNIGLNVCDIKFFENKKILCTLKLKYNQNNKIFYYSLILNLKDNKKEIYNYEINEIDEFENIEFLDIKNKRTLIFKFKNGKMENIYTTASYKIMNFVPNKLFHEKLFNLIKKM